MEWKALKHCAHAQQTIPSNFEIKFLLLLITNNWNAFSATSHSASWKSRTKPLSNAKLFHLQHYKTKNKSRNHPNAFITANYGKVITHEPHRSVAIPVAAKQKITFPSHCTHPRLCPWRSVPLYFALCSCCFAFSRRKVIFNYFASA